MPIRRDRLARKGNRGRHRINRSYRNGPPKIERLGDMKIDFDMSRLSFIGSAFSKRKRGLRIMVDANDILIAVCDASRVVTVVGLVESPASLSQRIAGRARTGRRALRWTLTKEAT